MSEQPSNLAPKARSQSPTLSNSISLSAVGAMLLIAAVGILVLTGSTGTRTAGTAVLVATGLIILIAGGVLIYAALKNQKPGWFLPFTIVGAVLSFPVLMGGATLGAWNTTYDYTTGSSAEYLEEDSDFGWTEDYDYETEDDFNYMDGREVDPSESNIEGYDENLLLDLTALPEGQNPDFDVDLEYSNLTVLLTSQQLPMFQKLNLDDTSYIEATSPTTFLGNYEVEEALVTWTVDPVPSNYPWDLGRNGADASNVVSFRLTLDDSSSVHFVILDNLGSASSGDEAQSGANETAQSGEGN